MIENLIDLKKIILENKVIVCCGTGGVGKTTTSAALGILAASLGKKTVIVTIDPAKRLATSLGLESLGHDQTDLTETINKTLKKENRPVLKASLHAVMPDTTKVFEDFVRAMAKGDESKSTRVLRTTIFQVFMREFSGANEYMAMEKLYQLYESGKYDLIVLDTPPSSNTLTFLESPRLLGEFFDEQIIKWFISPSSKIVTAALKKFFEILEKLTGKGFISDLLEFTHGLFAMRAQFMDNLSKLEDLLHQKVVQFLVVTTPERLSQTDTAEFINILKSRGFHFSGILLNRVLFQYLGMKKPEKFNLESIKNTEIKDQLLLLEPRLIIESKAFDWLQNSQTAIPYCFISEQNEPVNSIEQLIEVSGGMN